MKNYKFILSLSALLSFNTLPAFAASLEPYSCRNGFFPKEQQTLQLAEVNTAKGEKLYFYDDAEGCPNQTAQCKKKSYVIAGDHLIINSVKEGWACAWFQGKKSETVGWVNASQLQFSPSAANVDKSAWLGSWKYSSNSLKINQEGDKLQIVGEAFWDGPIVAGERVIHTGELGGELRINANHAHLSDGESDYGCVADFSILGNYLVVADNGNCGGANVSFSGVYIKAK